MKRIVIVLMGLLFSALTAIAEDGIYNGILVLQSSNKDFKILTIDNISGTLNYHVELYTDGKDIQYCLCFAFDESRKYLMFPTYCTLLLRTKQNDVIELQALYTYDNPGRDKVGWAFFPISSEELDKIIYDGVTKFRVEVMANADHHKTIAETVWGKNTFGHSIKNMVASVNSKLQRKNKDFTASQEDIHSGF